MINLADNTNRWGAAPSAGAAIALAAGALNEYPSLYGRPLKEAAAAYIGVRPEHVATGCGSDNLIDATIRAVTMPGDRIAWCAPTFVMLPVFAALQRLEVVALPFRADWDIDVDALLGAAARVIYVCTPCNPLGTIASRDAIGHLLRASNGIVIVDEAYAEYSGLSMAADAPDAENVIVMRTLSKAFGLAGLRAGYGVAAPALIRRVEEARGPYTLSRVAELAASAALLQDVDWMRGCATTAVEHRERLRADLLARGFVPLPSAANFVCVPVPDAARAAALLAQHDIRVRAFTQLPGIGDAVRITVGPWDELERLLAVMEELQ